MYKNSLHQLRLISLSSILTMPLVFFINKGEDWAHEYYFLVPAVAHNSNLVVHRDIFNGYGPFTTWYQSLFLNLPFSELMNFRLSAIFLVYFQILVLLYFGYLMHYTRFQNTINLFLIFIWIISADVFIGRTVLLSWPSLLASSLILISTLLIMVSLKDNVLKLPKSLLLISGGVLASLTIFTRIQVGILFIILVSISLLILVRINSLDYSILKLFLSGVFFGTLSIIFYLSYSLSLVPYFNQVILYSVQYALDTYPFFIANVYDRFEPRVKDVTLIRFILDFLVLCGLIIIIKTCCSLKNMKKNNPNYINFLLFAGGVSMLSQAYPSLDNSHLWWALPAFIPILSTYNYAKFRNSFFIVLSFFILVQTLYILFFANSFIKNQSTFRNLALGPPGSIIESMLIPQESLDFFSSNHKLLTNSNFGDKNILFFSYNPILSIITGTYLNSDPYYEIFWQTDAKIKLKIDYLLNNEQNENVIIVDNSLLEDVLSDLRFAGIDNFTLINSNEYISLYKINKNY